MSHWQLSLDLDARSDNRSPVFVRIARSVSDDITRGRLRAGQRLPGTRTLARSLGVHRNTVVAAFDELVAQGWVETDPARGTFVSKVPVPLRRVRNAAPDRRLVEEPRFLLPDAPERASVPIVPKDTLFLAGGRPDPRLFPTEEFARAHRRSLRLHGREVLDYGDPRGEPRLRAALASMLADRRGVACEADDVLVTRGAQMAIWLAAHVLVEKGDRIAVEANGYPPAWKAMREAGAELCPIPVDRDGMRVEELAPLLAHGELRAVYVTPHHQFPTMAVLAPARRIRLLELARRHRFAILEDDYDNEYHYHGRPVLPLASLDESGSVIYIGTLSKVLAPGLRIGFMVAPRVVVERAARARSFLDRQGDRATELAIAELLEDGEVQRHAQRARRVYSARRDVLITELRARLGDVVDFELPAGGLALWARVARGIDVDRWAERSLARGVGFQHGRLFAFDRKKTQTARFGFASLDEKELGEAIRRLAAALPA
jgi:GntR family transcriptional regulator/MocR family aminotransferase